MLVVHRSERADSLVDALGRVLADPLGDAIRPEVVAVPTRGVERWLTQRLSHTLGGDSREAGGVCANLDFPFPATLLGGVVSAVTGLRPEEDPWRPERCMWPLVELIDERRGDGRLAPLIGHLEAATPADASGQPGPLRRLAMARHIADLYDRYAVHRPELILSWLDRCDQDPSGPTEAWQAHLWRLLRARIATPGPAERLDDVIAAVRRDPDTVDLPARLSVFGLTRLPASHLAVLGAVAEARDVHLYILHPSDALWERTSTVPGPSRLPDRSADPTARLPTHPLLRSWGRDARELQLVLAAHAVSGGRHYPVPGREGPVGVLQAIQADIRADRAPGAVTRPPVDPGDRSLQLHSCHGRTRQVEVARDAILHLLDSDPTLEARDVIVMCPDIEAFAPLIHAAFGIGPEPPEAPGPAPGGSGTLPVVRVRLADRSLRQTNPLLAVAAQLLDLAGSRATASAVLDLISRPPVSRRFRFDPDDISTLERWAAGAGIRWGLDAAARRRWQLERVDENTWSSGLDRLLLGVAMSDDECRVFAGTVPFDDVPSTDVDLAGRFAEMVGRLGRALQELSGPQPASGWVSALLSATSSLAQEAPGEEWQHDQLVRTLSEAAGSRPSGGGAGPDLSLDEIRSLMSARLQGRPTRANFRTGDLTICTLVPMRSVPHRVVVLLGLDDGTYPRQPELDGDDLLADRPRVGDRDPRSEDRQLLLDALMAAEDHLIITYSGRDERTNRLRPPCAPVAELLDVLDATFADPPGPPPRQRVVVAHPLQTFDPANFEPGALGVPGPWSFDPVALGGARAATSQAMPADWLGSPLPAVDEPVVQLDHLIAFVQHPVRSFLRRRLGLYLSDRDEELDDGLPLELDPLQKWEVGDRLLASVMAGIDLDQAVTAERRRGFLPPGAIADPVLADICSEVDDLHRVCLGLGIEAEGSESLEVRVDLPGGRVVVGSVPGVRGCTIAQCNYSRLGAKHRLAAWVRFLALSADRPGSGIRALTVGRGTRRSSVAVARLEAAPWPDRHGPAALPWPVARLQILVDLYDRGMRTPLPLSCRTGAAWVQGRRRGESEDQLQTRVGNEWLSNDRFPGEQADAEHVAVWGSYAPASVLLASVPDPSEAGPDWADDERSRFGLLARRLWDPLLDHEALEER